MPMYIPMPMAQDIHMHMPMLLAQYDLTKRDLGQLGALLAHVRGCVNDVLALTCVEPRKPKCTVCACLGQYTQRIFRSRSKVEPPIVRPASEITQLVVVTPRIEELLANPKH